MWFEFITNTECNWNCDYCTFQEVPNHMFSIDIIKKHQYIFDIMKRIDVENVIIEGGEIGLIKDNNILEYLFKSINRKVIIDTNGEFFKTDRSQLYKYIDKIFYHVAPDAKTLFKIKKPNIPIDVVYGIVDDDKNAIEEFSDYNSHINIEYKEYEYINKLPNFVQNIKQYQKSCWVTNPFVCIDLSREVLLPCAARGAHITIPLTKENLISILTKFSNFKGKNYMCDTCYRMCSKNKASDVIKRKNKLRKIL